MENFGWKCYRISNLGGGKFRVENAVSNLEFGGGKFLGGKCCLESRNLGGGKFGVKMLSRISNLGVENLGWKCYLESPIGWVENLG